MASGNQNQVADALSWSDDRNDNKLNLVIHTLCPKQVPEHFKTVLLPGEIILSYITSAEINKEKAVTRAIHGDQVSAWRCWNEWCNEVGL